MAAGNRSTARPDEPQAYVIPATLLRCLVQPVTQIRLHRRFALITQQTPVIQRDLLKARLIGISIGITVGRRQDQRGRDAGQNLEAHPYLVPRLR